jgi:hypothetical protein
MYIIAREEVHRPNMGQAMLAEIWGGRSCTSSACGGPAAHGSRLLSGQRPHAPASGRSAATARLHTPARHWAVARTPRSTSFQCYKRQGSADEVTPTMAVGTVVATALHALDRAGCDPLQVHVCRCQRIQLRLAFRGIVDQQALHRLYLCEPAAHGAQTMDTSRLAECSGTPTHLIDQ